MSERTGEKTNGRQTRPWTVAELAILRTNAHLGAAHLAALLNRTPHAVHLAASRNRISLRKPNETRGLVLGQPRGHTLPPTQRATMLDPANAQRIDTEARALLAGVDLCPICTQWPVNPTTGVCRPCWLAAIAESHRHQLAIAAAQRNVNRARQEKHRGLVALAEEAQDPQ